MHRKMLLNITMMTMMMNATTETEVHNRLKEACCFLSHYAGALLGSGATCIRIEKNIGRMAQKFGVDAEVTLLPTHTIVVLWDKAHEHSYSCFSRAEGAIDFCRNIEMSKMSWQVAQGKLSIGQAQKRLEEILGKPRTNKWVVLLLAAVANASFCRLFGGDVWAVGIVFCATLLGFFIKQILVEDDVDVRLATIAAGFVASVVGAAGNLFGFSATPDVALGTSVLFLIPGIPYINAGSDLLTGHYLCSVSRFIQAAILTVCLSLGLCGGMLLMQMKFF